MRLEVPSTLLLLLTTVAIGTAHAQKREHDAHEHGHGALNIVIADSEMLVEMEVPGVHVAGFEHVPKTDAERAAVDAVVKRMRDGGRWFVASTGAGCELEHAEVAMSYDEHHDDHDKHAKHDDHDHGKHKKHDDHDHGSEDHEEEHDHEEPSDAEQQPVIMVKKGEEDGDGAMQFPRTDVNPDASMTTDKQVLTNIIRDRLKDYLRNSK